MVSETDARYDWEWARTAMTPRNSPDESSDFDQLVNWLAI